jgi:flagellin-like protein
MVKGRRGVSPVIATVLILLITVAAAALIAPFVIKFIRGNLDDSGSCFEILGDLSFAETGYNCYNSLSTAAVGYTEATGFSVKINNDNIVGFKVTLLKDGGADTREISLTNEDSDEQNVRVLGSTFSTTSVPVDFVESDIPSGGGIRTYVANGIYDNIEIFPILKEGKVCGLSDAIKVEPCIATEDTVIGGLHNPIYIP